MVLGAAEDRSGSFKGVGVVFGVFWKKPWRVFWFFIFCVLEVDFLRTGVEATGVEAEADGVPFAMLDLGLPLTSQQVPSLVDSNYWATSKKILGDNRRASHVTGSAFSPTRVDGQAASR
jgi:hypothetical protein